MNTIRIDHLAKELGVNWRDLVPIAGKMGVEIKHHANTLNENVADKIKETFQKKKTTQEAFKPIIRKVIRAEVKVEQPAAGEPAVDESNQIKAGPAAPASEVAVAGKAPEAGSPETVAEPKKVRKVIVKKVIVRRVVKAAPVAEAKPAAVEAAPQAPPKAAVPPEKKIIAPPPRKQPYVKPAHVKPPRHRLHPVEASREPIEVIELKPIELPEPVTVGELASRLEVNAQEIIKFLMKQGMMIAINQNLDFSKAALVARNFGYDAKPLPLPVSVEIEKEDGSLMLVRPPVVTVLGHVDHGKTKLLDAIRKTNVVDQEAGGITQKIGAYVVERDGRKISFLDTPGHEAFTAMRARGSKVTDVAVLVVAADDGVMPQTIEAINHARAAKVPIIVAINKVDKPQANPERVKQQLADLELLPEDWGGDTICIPVSAKQNIGIEELLEMILLVADMQDLRANPNRKAQGTIIEAKLDKGLGPVATVLVQSGTLRNGDAVVAGLTLGKVKALVDDKGARVRQASPSIPVEIIGLEAIPSAGDILQVVEDEKLARQIAESRVLRSKEEKMKSVMPRATLDDLMRQSKEEEARDLNVIIKADGQGSVEALRHALLRLSGDKIRVGIIHSGVGTITESDIMLASASKAIIIGFNVRPDPMIKKLAEQESIDIRLYRVIYHVIEDIKAAIGGMFEPEFKEVMTGRAEIRQIFKLSKLGVISGAYVMDGKMVRDAQVRIIRDSVVVYEGVIDSLKRFKDDVREVQAGFECGIGIKKFGGLQPGDIVECFQLQEIPREAGAEA
jgi:translation initiation factor IF-2